MSWIVVGKCIHTTISWAIPPWMLIVIDIMHWWRIIWKGNSVMVCGSMMLSMSSSGWCRCWLWDWLVPSIQYRKCVVYWRFGWNNCHDGICICMWKKKSIEKDGGWWRVPFICLFNMRPCNTVLVSLRRQSHTQYSTIQPPQRVWLFLLYMHVLCLPKLHTKKSIYNNKERMNLFASGWPDLDRLGEQFSFGLE